MIKIGLSGIGGAKEAEGNLELFSNNGITAAEIAFTYSVYLKKDDAIRIGKLAKEKNISLSIHGSYFINLNSDDESKIEASKKRILEACNRANDLGVTYLVFHAAFYLKSSKDECYSQVKEQIIDLQKTIKANGWNVKLAPETTGKGSQFGTLDELLRLSKETGCHFCIDFAHIKARANGKIDYPDIMQKLKDFGKHIHSHFAGIEYGPKGERKHLMMTDDDVSELLTHIKKADLDITIISESPDPFADAVKMIDFLKYTR